MPSFVSVRKMQGNRGLIYFVLSEFDYCIKILQDDPPPLDLNEVGSQGRTVLHVAADYGNRDTVEYLVELGVNVETVVLGTKETALHICARRGHTMVSDFSFLSLYSRSHFITLIISKVM